MYNTASVTVVRCFPAMNLGSLFPGTSKMATGVPLKQFPSQHSFVLSEGGGKKKKRKKGGVGKKKRLSRPPG